MLDDDLARKIFFFFLFFLFEREREERGILVAFDPIFRLSSIHSCRGDRGSRDREKRSISIVRLLIGFVACIYIYRCDAIEGGEGKDGCVSAAQLCKSITWRGWVVGSRANLHRLLLFTRRKARVANIHRDRTKSVHVREVEFHA